MMQISLLESLICFILIFTQNQSNEESEQVTQLVVGEYPPYPQGFQNSLAL